MGKMFADGEEGGGGKGMVGGLLRCLSLYSVMELTASVLGEPVPLAAL